MKGRTIGRHFRESFKSLGRNGWMTFASFSAVTVTLILVGVFSVIMMNLNHIADDLENDVEIRVLIEIIEEEGQKNAAEEQLLAQVQNMPDVASVAYSTKEQELEDLIKDFGEELSLYEQSNPLHNVLYVKAINPQQTAKVAEEIEKLDYTYEVLYGKGKVENLFSFLNISRNIGFILIIGLLFTAMFLISNTIRITIFARREEIEIMKLVGATNSFVRIPFVLEGIWIGLLGSIIPVIVVSITYYKLYDILAPRLRGNMLELLPVTPLLYQVSVLVIGIGLIIGMWGSFMSVRKFLKV